MSEFEAYLDNAATCPPYPSVIEAITETLTDVYGNPSALHAPGKRAKELLEQSRVTVAEALDVEPTEIRFTSGGTESNNLAIFGAAKARIDVGHHIVTSSLEHPSVTKTVRGLKREGFEVDYIEAEHGNFDVEVLPRVLTADTNLITIMRVQNETGYIFPIEQVCAARDEYAPQALVHTDIVQAFGKIEVHPHELGVDLASMSAHKIGGPKGIGALFVKEGTKMFTTAFGGGQEMGLRSGTEAVHQIVGFAAAVKEMMKRRPEAEARNRAFNRQLVEWLYARDIDVIINSREDSSPFILSFSVPKLNNTKALNFLSDHGVYVSKASACANNHTTVPKGTWRPKHALSLQLAGVEKKHQNSTFRLSFSCTTSQAEIDRFIEVFDAFLKEQGR